MHYASKVASTQLSHPYYILLVLRINCNLCTILFSYFWCYDFPQKASTKHAVKSSIVIFTRTRSEMNLALTGVAVTIRYRSLGPILKVHQNQRMVCDQYSEKWYTHQLSKIRIINVNLRCLRVSAVEISNPNHRIRKRATNLCPL